MTRIRFTIDRVLTDDRRIDRAALEAALQRELTGLVSAEGTQALGGSASRRHVTGTVDSGRTPLATRVAQSAVKALKP